MSGAQERQPLLQNHDHLGFNSATSGGSSNEVSSKSTGQIQDNVLMIKVFKIFYVLKAVLKTRLLCFNAVDIRSSQANSVVFGYECREGIV